MEKNGTLLYGNILMIVFAIAISIFNEVEGNCLGKTTTLWATPDSRQLTSPNHPGNYFPYMSCKWLIRAENSSEAVRLDVTVLDIEYSFTCRYDYLQLNDGNSSSSAFIVKLCGTGKSSYISTGDAIFLTMVTDWGIQLSGFSLNFYSAEPGSELPAPVSIITNPPSTTTTSSGTQPKTPANSQSASVVIGVTIGSMLCLAIVMYFIWTALISCQKKRAADGDVYSNSSRANSANRYCSNIEGSGATVLPPMPPPYAQAVSNRPDPSYEITFPNSPPPPYEEVDPNRNMANILSAMFSTSASGEVGTATVRSVRLTDRHLVVQDLTGAGTDENRTPSPCILVAPMSTRER